MTWSYPIYWGANSPVNFVGKIDQSPLWGNDWEVLVKLAGLTRRVRRLRWSRYRPCRTCPTTPEREFIDYKTSLTTFEDPLRGVEGNQGQPAHYTPLFLVTRSLLI